MKITKKALINDFLEKYPEAASILMAYGLHCVGCYFSGRDTIEDGARIHGLGDEEIEMMIKDLNISIKNKENEKTKPRSEN